MTIPFLGIYLGEVKGMNPATIGDILATSMLAGTCSSFIGGLLSDRLGRFPVMITAMTLWSLVFIGFAFAEAPWQFFLLSACNGLFRNVFEPTAKALLVDVTKTEKRAAVFHARYFAINVGGAVGPLLGLQLGAGGTSSLLPFAICSGIYLAYVLVLVALSRMNREAGQRRKAQGEPVSMRAMARIVFTDRVFLCFLIGNAFVANAYGHLDTTLSQFLGHDNVKTYSFLFMVNAVSVLLLQYPLVTMMRRFSSMTALTVGCLFFGLGLFGFGLFDQLPLLALSVVVFTVGEILSFVIGDVLIGEIAPADSRGTYYGASGLAFIGQSGGAWLGGLLLHSLGFDQGPIIFGLLMLITFAAFPFFFAGQRLRTRLPIPEEQERAA